jgi:hypothetical protein
MTGEPAAHPNGTSTENPAMWKFLIAIPLLLALLVVGCDSSVSSSGGELKPLPGNRIPKGHGPTKG